MAQRSLWLPWRRGRAPDAAATAEQPDGAPSANGAGTSDELRARREEIARMEERALRETESLAVQRADLDRRLQAIEDRERNLVKEAEELKQKQLKNQKEGKGKWEEGLASDSESIVRIPSE